MKSQNNYFTSTVSTVWTLSGSPVQYQQCGHWLASIDCASTVSTVWTLSGINRLSCFPADWNSHYVNQQCVLQKYFSSTQPNIIFSWLQVFCIYRMQVLPFFLILVPFYLSYYLFPIIVAGSDRRLDEDEVDNLRSRRLSSTASGVSELNQGFVRCSMSSSVSSDVLIISLSGRVMRTYC